MIFIESKLFEKLREKYLDDDSYQALQNFLVEQPMAGDTMQGTGGLKKLRWSDITPQTKQLKFQEREKR